MATELHARGAKLGVLMSHDMSLHTLRTMIADKLATEEIEAEKQNLQRLVERLAADYGAEEVIVLTITYDFAARVRSYELLAEACRLPRA